MLRPERLLPDGQGALMECTGFRIVALDAVDNSEIVENDCDIRMLRSELLLPDGQGTLIERFGLRIVPLSL